MASAASNQWRVVKRTTPSLSGSAALGDASIYGFSVIITGATDSGGITAIGNADL